jgi:hypothetical protein
MTSSFDIECSAILLYDHDHDHGHVLKKKIGFLQHCLHIFNLKKKPVALMKKKLPKNSGRGGIYVKYFVYWQALFITSKSEPFGGIIPDRLRSASGLKSAFTDLIILNHGPI